MNEELTLVIDGAKYAGWKTAQVSRSIEALCGSFDLTVTDPWTTVDLKQRPIMPETPCKIMYGQDLLLTGFVDNVDVAGRKEDHTIKIKGRDKTADLVDCSVIDCPAEFNDVTLGYFIGKISGPYGIKLISNSILLTKIPQKISINPGEKCFDAIDRACRSVGCFATSTLAGEITAVRAGDQRVSDPLAFGKNIKTYSGSFGIENRYKNYIVIAQQPGTDTTDGTASAQVKATATDPGMMRGRTIKLIAEKSMTIAEAKTRANWECAVRAGRSGNLDITVQGWRDGSGAVWTPNRLIDVYLPHVFGSEFYQEMLITSVIMSLDIQSGTTTQLQLRRKDSALPQPLKPVKGDPWNLSKAIAADLAGGQ